MNALRIYRVTDHYIAFLHSRDSRVQFNKQTSRPYVGVVLHVGEFKYFVPMESPKPHHKKIKPDTMSATAQNYVYRVKITDEKAMQDKPSISREELERIKREVAQYLVRPGERKN